MHQNPNRIKNTGIKKLWYQEGMQWLHVNFRCNAGYVLISFFIGFQVIANLTSTQSYLEFFAKEVDKKEMVNPGSLMKFSINLSSLI